MSLGLDAAESEFLKEVLEDSREEDEPPRTTEEPVEPIEPLSSISEEDTSGLSHAESVRPQQATLRLPLQDLENSVSGQPIVLRPDPARRWAHRVGLLAIRMLGCGLGQIS